MQFVDDVGYAMRQFAHAPGFTATAVLRICSDRLTADQSSATTSDWPVNR
jgi:hypothetical protein